MARMRRELCFSAGSFTYAGLYQMWGRVPVAGPFRFFEECRYEYRYGRRGACATGNFQHAGWGQVPVERPDPEGDPEGTPGCHVGVRADVLRCMPLRIPARQAGRMLSVCCGF